MFRFGRNRFDDPGAEFWKWWPGARDGIAKAIVTGAFDDRIVNDISKHVQRVHPQMAWELQPGSQAAHAFCLSSEGNPELRQVALRWLERAPQPDATWEYHASKQPAKTLMTLMVAGGPVRPRGDAREHGVGRDPAAPRRPAVAPALRRGAPRTSASRRPSCSWTTCSARTASSAGSARSSCSRGRPAGERRPSSRPRSSGTQPSPRATTPGSTARSRGPTEPSELILADVALKRIDHPFHDWWVWVQMLWGADRFPTDAEAEQLNAEEDNFLERMGERAILAARVTVPGSRTWHFVSEDFEKMRPAIDGWAEWLPDSLSPGLPQRRLKIDGGQDMTWQFQRDLGIR